MPGRRQRIELAGTAPAAIAVTHFFPCDPPFDFRRFARTKVYARDLQNEKFILMQDGHCLGAQAQQFCNRKGFQPEISCRSAQIGTVLAMVQTGLGISLIPEMALPSASKDGIVFRSLDGVRPRRVLALAVAVQRKPSLCVLEFTKFVLNQRMQSPNIALPSQPDGQRRKTTQ